MSLSTRTLGFTSLFALISVLGAWFMRVEPAMMGIPKDFDKYITAATLPNAVPLKTTYTGIEAVDKTLAFFVAAFIFGSAGWDRGIQLQQIYFLVAILPVLAIWNVEAFRKRNKGSILSL
jgi:hypothetical protein